jgi:hypothetical protein
MLSDSTGQGLQAVFPENFKTPFTAEHAENAEVNTERKSFLPTDGYFWLRPLRPLRSLR